jgi:hypothetical protein
MSLESIFICVLEHGGSKEGNVTEKAVQCHTKEDEKLYTMLWYYKVLYFAKVNSDNEEEPHSAKQRRSISICCTSYSSVVGWNIEPSTQGSTDIVRLPHYIRDGDVG